MPDIETLAVSKLEGLIAETDLIRSYIAKKDREPSWDGNIYIHKIPNNKKALEKYPHFSIVTEINYLQIIKRKNVLNFEQKKKLYAIIESEEKNDEPNRLAIYCATILLDGKDAIKRAYDKLSEADLKTLEDKPILNLLKEGETNE